MGCDMGRNPRHFLDRGGRYFARIVVPKELRPYLDNKTELRAPLGPDRRTALRHHPIAVAELMQKIAVAERALADAQGIAQVPGRYPLSDAQIAFRSYSARLVQDAGERQRLPGYASVSVDETYAAQLRAGMAGHASDAELEELVGHRIAHYRKIGNTIAVRGTPEWRSLAMALCVSEYEALSRVAERDEGDFAGIPAHPMIRDAEPEAEGPPPIPLRRLLHDYLGHLKVQRRSPATIKRWRGVLDDFVDDLGHDDARRVTRKDAIAWRDKLLTSRSAKTVSQTYLGALRAAFNWAVAEDRLDANPVEKVRQAVPKKTRSRQKGYTDEEARAILKFSRAHEPKVDMGIVREAPTTTLARRWGPLLAAHTGARITEIMQLRKSDLRQEDGSLVIRITLRLAL